MRTGALVAIMLCLGWGGLARPALQTVSSVDLTRYMGRWYSIASIPTPFERRCAAGTTAEYTLLPNGRVEVVNRCYTAQGSQDTARGNAWIPDPSDPAKLRVSFVRFLGLWWFGAPYWIIDLAEDYTYAVVGHPSRRYGWILSRTPCLPEAVLEGIFQRLETQGYLRDAFQRIPQIDGLDERP